MHLLGRERRELCRHRIALEQFVLRRNDVLDLRRVLGLLQRQRVDQDALVGDRAGGTLQLGQLPMRPGELAQDGGRLQGRRLRQGKWLEDGHALRKRRFFNTSH